jgi:hypothetical protein
MSGFYARSQNYEKRLLASLCESVCLSVRMEQVVQNGRFFLLNIIFVNLQKSVEKIKLHKNLRRITGNLHEDPTAFIIISRVILRRIKNV